MNASFSDHPNHGLIQVAAELANGQKQTVSCIVSGLDGKRLTACTSEPIPVSSAISVEYEDALFLGEVVTCSGTNGKWNLEIKVQQILTGLQSLMTLRERLLGEGVAQQAGITLIAALS